MLTVEGSMITGQWEQTEQIHDTTYTYRVERILRRLDQPPTSPLDTDSIWTWQVLRKRDDGTLDSVTGAH